MEDLRQYAVFAQVVGAGSMSAAARRLGMTPSAVSQTIRALEARTGVLLLHRSTRKLSLTEAGERCLPHCRRLLDAGDAAAASLEQARDAPTGELRISAPAGFGPHLALALSPVLGDWPALRLRLIVGDRLIDLIEARVDIALRVGDLPDTAWIGRKLCEFDRILCASPSYLERRGTPGQPGDLNQCDWLKMTGTTTPGPDARDLPNDAFETISLELTDNAGNVESLRLPVRTCTTGQVALQQLCEEGAGIAALFYQDVRTALERGSLVRLLAGWRLPSHRVTMVTPSGDREPAKARVAGEALRRYFSRLPRIG